MRETLNAEAETVNQGRLGLADGVTDDMVFFLLCHRESRAAAIDISAVNHVTQGLVLQYLKGIKFPLLAALVESRLGDELLYQAAQRFAARACGHCATYGRHQIISLTPDCQARTSH